MVGRRCCAAGLADQQVSPTGFAFVPTLTETAIDWIYPEIRSWRANMRVFGSGSGGEWAGKSGDKSHAVQTLRDGRAVPNFAPAFGLHVLEHRFAPHGNDAPL